MKHFNLFEEPLLMSLESKPIKGKNIFFVLSYIIYYCNNMAGNCFCIYKIDCSVYQHDLNLMRQYSLTLIKNCISKSFLFA